MGNFYTDVILRDVRFLSPAACYDPELLEPHFRAVVYGIIADANKAGKTLHIGETYRSQARQALLYSKGLTKLAHVGVHGYGLACDLTLTTNGVYDPVGEHYAFLLELCRAHPCPWGPTISGVDWGMSPKRPVSAQYFHDWDHVQGVTVAQQARLFAGAAYPGAAGW